MEYLDILNPDGSPTEESKTREEAHEKGLWHKAVHAWVINDKNELLIQKRAACKLSHPDMWDISIAGHIDAGDTSIKAGVREAKEELGVDLTEDDLEYLFTVTVQSVQNNNTYFNNEFNDVFLIRRNLDPTKLKLQEDEVAEVKFIDYKELEQIIKNEDKNYVKHDAEYSKLFEYLNNQNKGG